MCPALSIPSQRKVIMYVHVYNQSINQFPLPFAGRVQVIQRATGRIFFRDGVIAPSPPVFFLAKRGGQSGDVWYRSLDVGGWLDICWIVVLG